MNVKMYTDGACSGNPGPGGYGCLICMDKKIEKLSGFCDKTTNNRMELRGVLVGLEYIRKMVFQEKIKIENLEIISDSAYVVNAMNDNWVVNWSANGFINAKGEPIKNSDMWLPLLSELGKLKSRNIRIKFIKVKGHNGNYFNEEADRLAKKEIEMGVN